MIANKQIKKEIRSTRFIHGVIHTVFLWFGLTTAASGQVGAIDPLLFLNHFFVVVDEPTYQDIQDSEFLRNIFAVTQSRTTKRNDAEYSGFYLYGETTYFEFLKESNSTWQSGIVLSPDDDGNLERITRSNLPQLYMNLDPVAREFDGAQVPWFFTARNFGYPVATQLGFGIMQYHPDYLSQYHPDIEPQLRGVSRRDVLIRYAAIEGVSQSDRLLGDVTGITVVAAPAERAALGRIFESLEFTSNFSSDQDIFTGNDFELKVSARTNSTSKITEVRLQLNREKIEEETLEFGASSRLHITETGIAFWSF